MMREFTLSSCRRLIAAAAMVLGFASTASAGSAYYAYYGKLVSYPTGAGQVYASTDYDIPESDCVWDNESELKFVSQIGSYYAYAKPANGWLLAGFSKATMADDYSSYEFSDELLSYENPGYLTMESSITDDPTGAASDSATVAGYMPLDPQTVHYAIFSHVVAQYAAGQDSLGTLKVSKVSNDIGDNVTLTATPADERCHFSHWTLNGTTVSTESSFDVQVTDTARYIAHFTCDSATIINFPAEGGYYMYYDDANDISVPANVNVLTFYSDSVRANSVSGKDNFIIPMEGSYSANAGDASLLFGKGEATFIKTPSSYVYPNEYSLMAWSGSEGVSIAALETNKAYYSFDTTNSVFKKLASDATVPANTTYLALPDSCFDNLSAAPEMFYIDSVAATTNGIGSVTPVSLKGNGKIYTIDGVQKNAMREDGLYIVDGKKIFFRKK